MTKSMHFSTVAEAFEKLEATSSRLAMTDILVELFKKTPKAETGDVALLCVGQFVAAREQVVLGIGDKLAIKAIAMAGHRTEEEVKKRFKSTGDLGLTAEAFVGKERGHSLAAFGAGSGSGSRGLTVKELFEGLLKIAKASGSRSQDIKLKSLAGMLVKAKPIEAKYVMRIALGTLRLGAGDKTVLDALAVLYTEDKKKRKEIEAAYNAHPDLRLVAQKLAEGGLKAVGSVGMKVGIPIQMMAAQRVKHLEQVPEKMEKFAVEEKYDGERVQIHKDGDEVNIFSRRLDNITKQYPDVVALVKKDVKAKQAIMEGEVVPVEGEHLLTFQTLMQRKRKYDIEQYVKKIPIRVFLFDVLMVDGESYMKKPYPERRKKLESIVKETKDFTFAKRIITSDLKKVQEFFEASLKHGGEGIMAKSLGEDSVYRAGAREWLWIKWKKDYLEGAVDTFDLVLVGAMMGSGKRAGVYGTLLGATYNSSTHEFETLCKVGTGFSDEVLEAMPKDFKSLIVKEKPKDVRVSSDMEKAVDVWFKPKKVMEISGAELTTSPIHTAGRDALEGKGLSLRFPRFKQFRDDKSAKQATTTKEVLQMYKS